MIIVDLSFFKKFHHQKVYSGMVTTDYSHIYEILAQSYDTKKCDCRFILRNILSRGAEEANYLSFQTEGGFKEACIQNKIYLESIISELHNILDRDGNVPYHHRATIRQAVTLARYLIAIEREQTASQLDMLDDWLRNPRFREHRSDLKAA